MSGATRCYRVSSSLNISGSGGGGGGITSVTGTALEVDAVTVGTAVTVGLPDDVTVTDTLTAGNLETNGDELLRGFGVTTAFERNRTFTLTRHIPLSTVTTGAYLDIISWRPYMEGTTNDPAAATFWGAVSFEINLYGSIGAVGEGYRRMEGVVYYAGSGASSAAGVVNNTNGSVTDFRVNRVGWVSTLQYQLVAPAINFNGAAWVAIHFARGAGASGNAIVWDVT